MEHTDRQGPDDSETLTQPWPTQEAEPSTVTSRGMLGVQGAASSFPRPTASHREPTWSPALFHHKAFLLLHLLWVSAKHKWWWLSPLLERSLVSVCSCLSGLHLLPKRTCKGSTNSLYSLRGWEDKYQTQRKCLQITYVIKSSNPNTQRSLKTQL